MSTVVISREQSCWGPTHRAISWPVILKPSKKLSNRNLYVPLCHDNPSIYNFYLNFILGSPTLADRVTERRAAFQLYLRLIADGAGHAGVKRGLLIWKCVIHALLARRVMFIITAHPHTPAHRAHRAGLTAARHFAEEGPIFADTHRVVGISAGRQHACEFRAWCTRLALLRVAEVLWECLAWRQKEKMLRGQSLWTYSICSCVFQSVSISEIK